ncbi:hypothetical protein D3C77_385190 [compost metagenome]
MGRSNTDCPDTSQNPIIEQVGSASAIIARVFSFFRANKRKQSTEIAPHKISIEPFIRGGKPKQKNKTIMISVIDLLVLWCVCFSVIAL